MEGDDETEFLSGGGPTQRCPLGVIFLEVPVIPLDRYARQMRFGGVGDEGQRRLVSSRVLIAGCGALGSVLANTLVRAGIGHVRLVDRDFLELNNLQRQVLYDEQDVQAGLPKAIAAAAKLERINSQITIEPIVTDISPQNVASLLKEMNCVVDGTDNFETRFLINDACLKLKIPWIYGGCIGAEGQTLTVLPGQTACLRCLMPEPPPPGTTETCDTAGILGPIINVIASIQACEAIKILVGKSELASRVLQVFDLWDNRVRQIKLDSLTRESCPACQGSDYPWLSGQRASHTATLCGRNAVQLSFPDRSPVELDRLAEKLAAVGKTSGNMHMLRLAVDKYVVTVFPDGRAIIGGTEDIAEARTVYAKYIGA